MQLIADTLNTLKARREEIETKVNARRDEAEQEHQARLAAIETELAEEIAELGQIAGFIRATERQEQRGSGGAVSAGLRAPRGQNRDKILAAIAQPRTTREISEATDIGRGSAARTLKQLVEERAARKLVDGRYVAVSK